jgi:hypothetical protein
MVFCGVGGKNGINYSTVYWVVALICLLSGHWNKPYFGSGIFIVTQAIEKIIFPRWRNSSRSETVFDNDGLCSLHIRTGLYSLKPTSMRIKKLLSVLAARHIVFLKHIPLLRFSNNNAERADSLSNQLNGVVALVPNVHLEYLVFWLRNRHPGTLKISQRLYQPLSLAGIHVLSATPHGSPLE